MKKMFFVFGLVIVIILSLVLLEEFNSQVKGDVPMNKKVLIAYFSWSDNTKHIAEEIQSKTGADMFRIETAIPYPSDYNETAYGVAKKQHDENILPELKDNGDVSNYDVIFVGTPAWWYTMAPAVKTFLTENDFTGKTIIPFTTHGGGGGYHIPDDMANLAKGANVIKNQLVIYGKGNSGTGEEIDKWLAEIKIK